ncbi:helix-turn-helix domain-containing protein [Nocardiopsis flavescens]|uniref:helix-turn-helix domain-containing protein n=1 Tax=Nocardiopsis flavescens TaxID=758803 RepID=UPI003658EBB6
MPEMRRAWGERDASTIIRLVRWNTDLSLTALVKLTGLAQSTLSDIISGKRELKNLDKINAALEGLGANASHHALAGPSTSSSTPSSGPQLAAIASPDELFTESVSDTIRNIGRLWKADLGNRVPEDTLRIPPDQLSTPLLRWLVAPSVTLASERPSSKPQVTEGDVHAIGQACDLFEALDHEFGGGHARTTAVQYLNSEIGPLLRGGFDPALGKSLFSATARFAAKVGAMAYDAGLHHMARRYFLQSLNLAHLGSDRLLGAKALGLLSHQANFLGDFRSSVDLARTAKIGAAHHTTPAIRAMLSAMEARGLASLGEEKACTRVLDDMEAAFNDIDPAMEPAWMSYFDGSEMADEFAHCFHDLGYGKRAITHAQQSLDLAPAGFRRSRTFAGLIQAGAHLKQPDIDLDAACTLARTAITEAGHLRSARVRTYIARLRVELKPYSEDRTVREFEDFLVDAPLLRG